MTTRSTITLAELIETMQTGLPYSKMAERLGYSAPRCFRRYCNSRGVRRHIRPGIDGQRVVIVEIYSP